MSKANETGAKKVKVKIPKEKNDARTHQFVSINDKNYMVEIGKWVEVPECVAKVLAKRDERVEAADAYIAAQSK